jgi:hypothetical protein
MDCDLETTRRRIALIGRIVGHYRHVAKEEAAVAAARVASNRLEDASRRLATAAATVVAARFAAGGDPLGRDEPTTSRRDYLRAIGGCGAFTDLDRLAVQLRDMAGADAPATPVRADAFAEFRTALCAWDSEATLAFTKAQHAYAADPTDHDPDSNAAVVAEALLAAADSSRNDADDASDPPGDTRCGDSRCGTMSAPLDASVTRHSTRWFNRIQGQETHPDVPAAGDKIIELARSERIAPISLTIYDVRGYLSRIKMTGLYNVAAAVMHYISGCSPPSISSEVLDRAAALFDAIVRVRRDVLGLDEGVNNYPYFIYKIFESIIAEDDPARRILYYIYLQRPKTLTDRDNEWRRICCRVPGLVLNLPTTRSAAAKYVPHLPKKAVSSEKAPTVAGTGHV